MEITTKIGCKVNCIYCPQKKFVKAYKKRSDILTLSFDTFKKFLDKIPITEEIRFSGMGEPYLNSKCTKMLLYAYKKGFTVSIYSTLVGINLSDIELIDSISFKVFVVHLPSQEGYEKIDVNNNYLKILRKIYKSRSDTIFRCNSRNAHPKVKEILGDVIVYGPLLSRAGNIKIKGAPFSLRKRGAILCPLKWRYGLTYLKTSAFSVLLPNGEVLFCCHDFGMKHILGNLLSSDYDSLFRSNEFAKIVAGMSNESIDILCRSCEIALEKGGY